MKPRFHPLLGNKSWHIRIPQKSSKAITFTVTTRNVNNFQSLNTIIMRSRCWPLWSFHKKIPNKKYNSKLKSFSNTTNASMKESREDSLSFSTGFWIQILWSRLYTDTTRQISRFSSLSEDFFPKTKITIKFWILMKRSRKQVHSLKE